VALTLKCPFNCPPDVLPADAAAGTSQSISSVSIAVCLRLLRLLQVLPKLFVPAACLIGHLTLVTPLTTCPPIVGQIPDGKLSYTNSAAIAKAYAVNVLALLIKPSCVLQSVVCGPFLEPCTGLNFMARPGPARASHGPARPVFIFALQSPARPGP
jgi:hypothetical protein